MIPASRPSAQTAVHSPKKHLRPNSASLATFVGVCLHGRRCRYFASFFFLAFSSNSRALAAISATFPDSGSSCVSSQRVSNSSLRNTRDCFRCFSKNREFHSRSQTASISSAFMTTVSVMSACQHVSSSFIRPPVAISLSDYSLRPSKVSLFQS